MLVKNQEFDFYNKIEYSLKLYRFLNEDDDLKTVLDQFLDKLDPKEREFANLRYKDKLTYEEIADIMKYSVRNLFKLRRKVLHSFYEYIMINLQ